MAAPVLSRAQWKEVQMASIAGIPDRRLAKEWKVSVMAIKRRRNREGWPTANKARIEQQRALQALKDKGSTLTHTSRGREYMSPNVTEGLTAMDVVSKSLSEYADGMAMAIVPALSEIATKAVTSTPGLFTPTDLKELSQAASLVWKLSGRDKPQSEVNISLWSGARGEEERDVTPKAGQDCDDEMLG